MKNKLMITISDVHGSKQYTLNQFITVIAKWIVLFIMIGVIAGGFYLNYLSKKADASKDTMHKAQELILSLAKQQVDLQKGISDKSQELTSMNSHLQEIEKILGLDIQMDSSPKNRVKHIKNEALLAIQKIEKEKLSKDLTSMLNKSIPNGEPINYKHISSKFGYRLHPISKKRSFHAGLDLSAPTGTPIYATADGVVEYAGKKGGYGNYILINHPYGFKTAYGHLSRFAVKKGTYIHKQDLIGYVGNTGRSTGPHLHYEILYLHSWLNPEKYMQWDSENYTDIMNQDSSVNWYGLTEYIQQAL